MALIDCEVRDRVRRRRYDLRARAQSVTALKRVAECGRRLDGEGVAVVVNETGAAGYAGVRYCGSVWACPACSAVIRGARAIEIQAAVSDWIAKGGGALWVTETVPHTAGDAIAETWSRLADGHRWALSGKRGVQLRGLVAYVGSIASTETTRGRHGWHPHRHSIILTEKPVSADVRAAFQAGLHDQWVRYAKRLAEKAADGSGPRLPKEGVGVLVREVYGHPERLAAYVAKVQDDGSSWQIGNEAARGDIKKGRRGGRTPFQLLEDLDEHPGKVRRWWRQYEAASVGRSAIRWSRGLRARLGLAVEKTDAELAQLLGEQGVVPAAAGTMGDPIDWVAHVKAALSEARATPKPDPLVLIEPAAWLAVCRVRGLRERILSIAERHDEATARAMIAEQAQAVLLAECVSLEDHWTGRSEAPPPDTERPPWWWTELGTVLDGSAGEGRYVA